MTDNRIYIACLASYNNGVLHGKWIEASADVDTMREAVDEVMRSSPYPNVRVAKDADNKYRVGELQGMLRTMTPDRCCGSEYRALFDEWMALTVPSAEEYAIHDHEGDALKGIGEYTPLTKIASLIEAVELATDELGDEGPAIVAAYWNNIGEQPDDAKEAVEQARECYIGTFASATEWAEQYLEDTGGLEGVPEHLKNYIDYEAYGRDAVYGGDIFESNGHWFYNR